MKKEEITAIKKYDSGDKDPLTAKIIGICYEVHNILGPGFVEYVYSNALVSVLEKTGLKYEVEKAYKVEFDGKIIGKFRVDFAIENKVILEIKAIDSIMPKIFESQIISYLKTSGLKVGLLVNFGNTRCQIRRLMV